MYVPSESFSPQDKTAEQPSLLSIPPEEWQKEDWKWQMLHRLTSLQELSHFFPELPITDELIEVEKRYPFALTPYYLSLIQSASPDDPVFQMAIPQIAENHDSSSLFRDPLGEEAHSPVPGLIHRYPDRAVLLLNGFCPVYCRHCTRKRLVGHSQTMASRQQLEACFAYLAKTPAIKDVILSGGEPLTLGDQRLEWILQSLRRISSVEVIRIGTRAPVFLPMRITDDLCRILSENQPVWIVTHFNHPNEITPLATKACQRLIDAGCPVNNQSVLLKGINDTPEILDALCRHLVRIRVRPYYLHQCDLIQGIEHLRTPLAKGIELMEALRGRLSGFAIPQFVVDLPQGHGKVPLLPNYILSVDSGKTTLRNHEGKVLVYPDPK